jgi:nucleoside-diphosphate-sugar epimerase
MYADDFAQVISYIVENEIYDSFNVATSENLSIKDIANIALDACDSNHLKIVWDDSKPNGQFRKDVSIDILQNKIPNFNPITLPQGIKLTYEYLINKGK